MTFKQLRPFQQRLIVSKVGILILLLLTYLSHFPLFMPIFAIAIGCTIAFALWEFYRLCQIKGFEPLVLLGLLGSLSYTLSFYMQYELPKITYGPQIVLFLILISGFIYFCIQKGRPIINLGLTFFGIVYLTIPLSFALAINFFHISESVGPLWFLYLLAVVKTTDIGAYLTGKKWGKNYMAPLISPKKTWEGAIGGFIIGTLTSVIYVACLGSKMQVGQPLPLSLALGLGALLSIAAQFGDLTESLIKRDAGVKDSNQLPGLGGMLDILDSLVFACPILYLFLIAD